MSAICGCDEFVLQARLADRCDGFSARDIACVASRIMHACLSRVSELGDPVDDKSQHVITNVDVDAALADFVPVSLRGVKLFKSAVEWKHVGGLALAKRTLKETLEFPIRSALQCLRPRSPLCLPDSLYGVVLNVLQVRPAVQQSITENAIRCVAVRATGLR